MWFPPPPQDVGLPAFPDSVVALRPPKEGLVLYRLIGGRRAGRRDFVAKTAAWLVAGGHPLVLTDGLSHYLTIESAYRVMRRPGFIARIVLLPSPTIHIARTGMIAASNHVTVWALPSTLLESIRGYFSGGPGLAPVRVE